MKTGAFVVGLLLLVGCASERPGCSGRLTPINHQPIRSDSTFATRRAAADLQKGTHS